ncbi:SusC/RagA family TonB-linked outer membrane protein [Terrimonas sp.]|uniref:SusC/RagA family TonB-linked outer membrane protein n=1 Tax=Terrimonas sp. TaxID=1914338 RepID=UPI00197E6AD9|nr:SusC/RagA family TonB-linked outer membrane protein [Terrimonas sp.]
MMKKSLHRFLLLLCFFAGIWGNAIAQNVTVSGRVTSAERPEGVPGVSVIVQGTTNGAITDDQGRFKLDNVAKTAKLLFTSVGFKSQTITVGNQTNINVSLENDASSLDQVVVIGYGTTKKKDLTGAIASVKATQLVNEHPASVQDVLRANVPGLNVGFNASAKGDASLQVRGKNTLNAGSSPLIVMDGVIYYGALADINPNDIETVDVLKDASSAAVYGAKAASGVIQITTKRGKTGKPTINVNSSVGVATMSVNERVYTAEEFLYTWRRNVKYSTNVNAKPYQFDDPRTLPSDISVTDWLAYDNSNASADPVTVWLQRLNLQPVEIENYKKGQSIDWYDMMFHNGIRQDHNISLSGRKEGINYYWSLGYMKNEGVIKGDDYNVMRSRLNIDAKVTNFLSVGMNTQFSIRDESSIPVDWSLITANSPWGSYYNDDSTVLRFNPNDEVSGGNNPFGVPTYTNRLKKYYELNASLYAKLSLPFGIKFQTNFTPRFEWYNYFNGESALWQAWTNLGGRATRENRNIYQWQIDNLLTWGRDFGKDHHLDFTGLVNAEKFQVWRNKVVATGFQPSDVLSYHNMGAATNVTVCNYCTFSDEGDDSKPGDEVSTADALMARLFYSYKSRYMLTLTVRRDGYSAFGQSNPRATFPSAALGWVFSDESFMSKASWLNYGKLRVSYGLNGNRDIGRYVALADLATGKYLHILSDGTVSQVSQLYVNNMQNKLLKWETTTAFNLGLDFSVANNRIDGSIDVYKSKTNDLLVKRTLPPIGGFDIVWDNLGQVDNKGIEISLNTKNIQRPNFQWNTSINFSLNRNKIVHLYGTKVDVKDANGNVIGQVEPDDKANKWFIGQPLDVIWDQKAIGIWQTADKDEAAIYGVQPGDFHIVDVNDDGKYTDDDRMYLGYTEPRFRWTMRNEFTFLKNFTFSFLMYSYWGHSATYNQAKNRSNAFPDRVNSYALPFWTAENPINDYARLFSSDGGASYSIYKKKSLIRLDNIALAYNLPQSLISRIHLQDLRFYFTIKNAGFYAPQWTFWDPENSGPTPRIYTLGINLNL